MRSKIDDLGKVSVTVEEDDYNSSKFYYENTIVVDPVLGMSCISLRPVPAGIPLTDTRFWKCLNKLESSIMINYRKVLDEVEDLKQIVNSIIENAGLGTPFSNRLGNSEIIGITQKALSDNFCEIRKRLSDLEGKNEFDFDLIVTPTYVISENSVNIDIECDVQDKAFDNIKIYFNDILKVERNNITIFDYHDSINTTTIIKVEAIIDGEYSSRFETVRIYNSENNLNN